jgi:hypothetical protein
MSSIDSETENERKIVEIESERKKGKCMEAE